MGDPTRDDYEKPRSWFDLCCDFDELRQYWKTQKETIRSYSNENAELKRVNAQLKEDRDELSRISREWAELSKRQNEARSETLEKYAAVVTENTELRRDLLDAAKTIIRMTKGEQT